MSGLEIAPLSTDPSRAPPATAWRRGRCALLGLVLALLAPATAWADVPNWLPR
jgi:hypothetical protein